MNLNTVIIDLLSQTGLPVEQDEYIGKCCKYIVFTYADETPTEFANNKPIADTAYLQIQLVTPKSFNYHSVKKEIRNLLENEDFIVTSTRSFLGDKFSGTERIRQTVFECQYTESRTQEE